MAFQMQPVKSSQIESIGYDAAAKKMAIVFKRGGALYHYDGVPQEVFDGLMSAESKGSHFGKHIRHQFKGVKQ